MRDAERGAVKLVIGEAVDSGLKAIAGHDSPRAEQESQFLRGVAYGFMACGEAELSRLAEEGADRIEHEEASP